MSYDRLDWHLDSALEAGQPERNAFTHIGLYLAWLIRRDLVDPSRFDPQRLDAVRRGELTGSDLVDDVDTKLVGEDLTDEGRAFSDASYDGYLAAYESAFGDRAPYSIADDDASWGRIAPLIDDLYAAWVRAGRPLPARRADEGTVPDRSAAGGELATSREEIERILAEMSGDTPPGRGPDTG